MYPIVTWGAARQKANLPDNAIYWREQSVYNSVQVAIRLTVPTSSFTSEMSAKTWLCICYDITDALEHMHQ